MAKEIKMKAGKDTRVRALAGAIVNSFTKDGSDAVKVTSIGDEALCKSVKSVAAAINLLEKEGINVMSIPRFERVEFENSKGNTVSRPSFTQEIVKIS